MPYFRSLPPRPTEGVILSVRIKLEQLVEEAHYYFSGQVPCDQGILKKFLSCFFWPSRRIQPLLTTNGSITISVCSDTPDKYLLEKLFRQICMDYHRFSALDLPLTFDLYAFWTEKPQRRYVTGVFSTYIESARLSIAPGQAPQLAKNETQKLLVSLSRPGCNSVLQKILDILSGIIPHEVYEVSRISGSMPSKVQRAINPDPLEVIDDFLYEEANEADEEITIGAKYTQEHVLNF